MIKYIAQITEQKLKSRCFELNSPDPLYCGESSRKFKQEEQQEPEKEAN